MKRTVEVEGKPIKVESTDRWAFVNGREDRKLWKGEDGKTYVASGGKWYDVNDIRISVRTMAQQEISNVPVPSSGIPAGGIIVQCYGDRIVFNSRAEAKNFYLEAMYECEGAESDRYKDIYYQLCSGRSFCSDGSDFHGLLISSEVYFDFEKYIELSLENNRKWKELRNA